MTCDEKEHPHQEKEASMKKLSRAIALTAAATLSLGVSAPHATAAQAGHRQAHQKLGTTSLAEVLAADGQKLDHNWKDFDIVEAAVYAVLAKKPHSKVGLLADGKVRLTAFIPRDSAFRKLVKQLTGKRPATEKATVKQVVKLTGTKTLETILLYHVVPGATITSKQAAKADGATLTTAQGGTLGVSVGMKGISLVDQDPDARNAMVKDVDLNIGNRQIAHGINRVLRPVDL
jgi:uncharacterized surface protein with fasciclin (FAS1) repeats